MRQRLLQLAGVAVTIAVVSFTMATATGQAPSTVAKSSVTTKTNPALKTASGR